MSSSDVRLDTSDGPARGYEVVPDVARARDHRRAGGLRRQRAHRVGHPAVAAEGYVGLAIDIFHRSGHAVAPYDDFRQAMALSEG